MVCSRGVMNEKMNMKMVALRLRGGGAGASTGAASATAAQDADHAGIRLLAALDDRLIAALESGAIKLVRAEALCDEATETEFAKIRRRQDLEELERSRGVRIFLTPSEAATALRAKGRLVGGLTYGWTTPDHPDVSGMVLAAVRRFLRSELGRAERRRLGLGTQEEEREGKTAV